MVDSSPAGRGSFMRQPRFRLALGIVVLAAIGIGVWLWKTADLESTDDAQVDAHVTPISARVGGVILRVTVSDNQQVEAGTVLIEIDPRDYQIAADKARAELADAEAAASAAASSVPVMSTQVTGHAATARGSVAVAQGGVAAAEQEIGMARARLTTTQARLRELEATAAKAAHDVDRLRGLLAKDEVSQQQFDATAATADATKAAAESAHSQIVEATAGIQVAESRLTQARASETRARAELTATESGPAQVATAKARAQAALARVEQAKATLAQAELNLQYTSIKAPAKGIVSRRTAETGQAIQPGQLLAAIIPLDTVWVTANFKETQLAKIDPGQPVTITVDTYGGRTLAGKVDSIAAATGARFSLLPPENATGNYVKVVQRVPVKIALDAGQDPEHLLRPGMSVVATVDTGVRAVP